MFVKIFQASANKGIAKQSKLVKFWTQKLFQIHAHVISAQKPIHFDATTKPCLHTLMQTLLSANQNARTILVTL